MNVRLKHHFERLLSASAEERGAAMILVIAWSMLLLGFGLIVSQAVVRQIAPSGRNEHSYAALAAAEAGLEDYRAHLQGSSSYYQTVDANNPALHGWTPVAGGSTTSEYTYAVDRLSAGTGGDIRVYSTGRSGGVTRTVMGIFTKRSTLDYVYMSDIETPAPTLPGAYDTDNAVTGWDPKSVDPLSLDASNAQSLAKVVCSHRWWEPGNVVAANQKVTGLNSSNVVIKGQQRNLNFCQWAGINSGETLQGRLHTNDIWRLNTSIGSVIVPPGNISSSCKTPAEDPSSGAIVCPTNHRYIATGDSTVRSSGGVNLADAKWSSAAISQSDAWRPKTGDTTGLGSAYPVYDTVLELPSSSNSTLKEHASETGCVFTGPTRIRFDTEGTYPNETGYMYVTSPDTIITATNCGGTGPWISGSTPATQQQTKKIALAALKDLVIYVQNVPRPAGADDPKNAWDLNNRWTATTEPTCSVKSTKSPRYPFVIPNDSTDPSYFTTPSGWKVHGYPSEFADSASPWYGGSCSSGDAYIEGDYKGQVTISTENNIILTGALTDSYQTPSTTTGQPNKVSQSTMGLVSSNFTYVYRPSDASGNWVADYPSSRITNMKVNATILVLDQCFAAQDPTFNDTNNSYLYIWGSLAQKYRCIVGNTGGFTSGKKYYYDTRLAFRTPPYLVELSTAPWKKDVFAEVTQMTQTVGVATRYPLYDPAIDTDVDSVTDPVVAFPSTGVTATKSGTNVDVTASAAGPVVVEYTMTYGSAKGRVTETRRLVILVQ